VARTVSVNTLGWIALSHIILGASEYFKRTENIAGVKVCIRAPCDLFAAHMIRICDFRPSCQMYVSLGIAT